MPNRRLLLLSLSKEIWPKVTAYALLGVLSALSAMFLKNRIPEELSNLVDVKTTRNILTILASSMLAVTTFSLSIMVSAYTAATSNVTPRATSLITGDKTTQNVLSTFLGTFLFSLVGIIALNMGLYEGGGRFILFTVTLGLVVLIAVTLIRWIERLTTLGRVAETNNLIEDAAIKAIRNRARKPTFGCSPLKELPESLLNQSSLKAGQGGYIQYFDVDSLARLADKNDLDVYVLAIPGKFVNREDVLAVTTRTLPDSLQKAMYKCFRIAEQRSFDQDPRFGLCVLCEVASRAMSAGLNDQGTAIDAISRLDRVLETYAREKADSVVDFKRVWVRELAVEDLFMDAFNPLVRDAAASFEVQLRLQKSFVHLSTLGPVFHACAASYSRKSLQYSDDKLFIQEEKDALRRIASAIRQE